MSTTTAHATGLALATLGGESMGTTWSVKLAAPPPADLHALHHGIQSVLDDVVAQMSNWEPGSDLERYNAAEAGSWHPLPEGFQRVLQGALEIAAASDGAFDPTVGALADAWGFGPSRRIDTSPTALEIARSHMGWRRIELDAANHRALQPGGVRLDLCAIAKGHSVDAVAAHLRDRGITDLLVEVGGELYGHGRKPDGTHWRVIVEAWAGDEDDATEPRVLTLDGLAVATSGERWHHHQHDGIRVSHTIDPRGGTPVRDAPAAVTVVASDAMQADGWATALTVLGMHAGYELACARGLAARFIAPATDGHGERMTPAFNALLDG